MRVVIIAILAVFSLMGCMSDIERAELQQTENEERIQKATVQCRGFGFKDGTENMASCVLMAAPNVKTDREVKQENTRRIFRNLGKGFCSMSINCNPADYASGGTGYGTSSNSSSTGYGTAPGGFLKGEIVKGLSKVCMYDQVGSVKAITISSTSLCPLAL
jgi:hypothetical protein